MYQYFSIFDFRPNNEDGRYDVIDMRGLVTQIKGAGGVVAGICISCYCTCRQAGSSATTSVAILREKA